MRPYTSVKPISFHPLDRLFIFSEQLTLRKYLYSNQFYTCVKIEVKGTFHTLYIDIYFWKFLTQAYSQKGQTFEQMKKCTSKTLVKVHCPRQNYYLEPNPNTYLDPNPNTDKKNQNKQKRVFREVGKCVRTLQSIQ